MERFQIQKEGEKDQHCLLCSEEIFRDDNTFGYFCLDCKPRVYICNFCKDIFLESHNLDHLIGMYFKDRTTFLDHYKIEIQETCEKLMFDEKFHECVRFCQNALSLNLSHEIAIYCLKMGMICHVNLIEYSEAKICGKNALKIIDHFELKENEDEVEIICKMCHIYLKLEKPQKCLTLGNNILERIEKGNLKEGHIPEETHYNLMYICGKALKEVGNYERSLRLLERVLKQSCQTKNFIQARFALATILSCYFIMNKPEKGLNKLAEYKKFYPLVVQKENDVDVSFIRLKNSINKLRSIPDDIHEDDLSNSMDGKMIAFNKQHYLAIIDNDIKTSYLKLIHSIEISEELIITLLKEKEKIREIGEEMEEEDGEHAGDVPENISSGEEGFDLAQRSIDQKLENVIKKRSQLIERIYCCCLLRNKPSESFQWAERGISYLCFARNLISKNEMLEEEEKQKLLMEKLNIQELLELARAHNIIFIFFMVVNELHFSIGDFVDVWIVKPNPAPENSPSSKKRRKMPSENPFFRRELVRVRLIHKPLEIVKMILEMYTEVNQVNAFFLNRIRKQKFRDHVDEIKRWQMFVDKLFTSNQSKFERYNELLEELYTYLIIPIQAYLPKGEIQTILKQKLSTNDFPEKRRTILGGGRRNWKRGKDNNRRRKNRKNKGASTPNPKKQNLKDGGGVRESFKYKKRLKEKPPNLVIVPDDFVSFIPFAFLKKSKNEFLIDYFNVSISHSIKMFYYNIFQLKNGRKMRKMMINDKINERLNPMTPPDTPESPRRVNFGQEQVEEEDDDDDDVPLNQSPLFINTAKNEVLSPLKSPVKSPQIASINRRRKNSLSRTKRAHSIKKIESPTSIDRIGKDSMFGFIMTDSYDEFRKTEILPIHQLFQATLRKNKMDSYCDSLMFSPSEKMKRSLQRIFKEFYDPFLGPKIVHIANRSSSSGKNLPTFQKEMSPNYGLQLMFDVTSNDRRNQTISGEKMRKGNNNKKKNQVLLCNEFENIFDFHGVELVVLSHNASIYTNSTFDGLNGVHRSVTNLGCPTILYPLFDVSEFFSTLFLVQFYKHLFGTDTQTKKSKSEAYRLAMISSMEIFPLLRKAPMFLSSFQLMGESMNFFKDDDEVEVETLNTLNSLYALKKNN